MPQYYTQVTLEHDSALPEDRSVNVWAMSSSGGNESASLTAWHNALGTFYTDIDVYLSVTLSGGCTIKSYDLGDPEPRIPILETSVALTTATNTLPAEVALCVSFQAVRVAGLPQSRRRGRIFLGPLGSTVSNNATGRPDTTVQAAIVAAADTLLTASKASAIWEWCVWSRTNNEFEAIDNGWVDNAWDTQRRRGVRPSSRSLFS